MAFSYEEQALAQPHRLTLDERGKLDLTGVSEVESFDEAMVVVHTTKGTLVIRGEGLHLKLLSLDGGQVHVDGQVNSMTYESDVGEPRGFLARLLG